MTQPNSLPSVQQPTNIMVYLGALILAGFLVYFSFMATNSLGLKEETGPAVIISKGYRAAGKTYTTQKIGNRTLTIPQMTPEMYVLELDIEDKNAAFTVSRQMYDRLDAGDQINAVYRRKRITGGIQVVAITR